jgi:hypothetical protein
VIGEIFDRVYNLGDLLSEPARGIQTVTVPAGGAIMVEFKLDVPGNYLLVDHACHARSPGCWTSCASRDNPIRRFLRERSSRGQVISPARILPMVTEMQRGHGAVVRRVHRSAGQCKPVRPSRLA